ncbi:UPAR/Ly6 domain-containing protein CG9338 [Anabrus simplex]|uniref:UPAR/Ly6 domain-containing protein CG9338 n=1 Tax=Anabrus simplex TaxID=316456 RepID=UPI0034DD25EC
MARVLLLFVLLAIAFKQGVSIKCYMCNSLFNEHCGDPLDTSQVTTTECTTTNAKEFITKLTNSFNNFAQNIGLGDMFPAGAGPVEMACQKMKSTDSNGKETVIRACILADSNGICTEANSAKEGIFCEQCKTDGCNGAGQLEAISLLFYLLIPCFIALVSLRS